MMWSIFIVANAIAFLIAFIHVMRFTVKYAIPLVEVGVTIPREYDEAQLILEKLNQSAENCDNTYSNFWWLSISQGALCFLEVRWGHTEPWVITTLVLIMAFAGLTTTLWANASRVVHTTAQNLSSFLQTSKGYFSDGQRPQP